MGLKTRLKYMIGSIRAKSVHLGNVKNIYIGKDVNIKGGANIRIGKNVTIRPHADIWCSTSGDLTIGDGSEIGERSRISAVNKIVIGKKVLLSPNI
jgi:acetyltransferase-like isoleucine patch superfamily enzyme